jgi:hypothetical protein
MTEGHSREADLSLCSLHKTPTHPGCILGRETREINCGSGASDKLIKYLADVI